MTVSKNVLVVHNCENLAKARRSTLDYIYCFERYAPENEYVYHRVAFPPTPTISSTSWDAVIFDSTAVGAVTIRPRERFQRLRERWAFLRNSPAVKIVFPQDDASHGALLDYWFNWMRVDAVFTVRPEKKDLIYPLTTKRADFISTVSGFIDDASADELAAMGKPLAERRFTFGQRATMYPAWGGRFAQRKGIAAARIEEECQRRGIAADISTDPKDIFLGDDWLRFLGDCRFVVGAEGGHSIWDPYGAIQDAVNDYVTRHPDAPFEEIEDACFFGIDGLEVFPGFAPRILEAALLGCGQVLMEGYYRGFVKPNEHYIPLKDDLSNMDEVFSAIQNTDSVNTMIEATRRDLVCSRRFRFSGLVADVMDYIGTRAKERPAPQVTGKAGKGALAEQHVRELHAALMTSGIHDEKLYEPYLTAWVRRELGGQVTDPKLRALLGIEEAAVPAADSAVSNAQRTDLEHMRAVLQGMGYEREQTALALSVLGLDRQAAKFLADTVNATAGELDQQKLALLGRLSTTIAALARTVAPTGSDGSFFDLLDQIAKYVGDPPVAERVTMLRDVIATATLSRIRGPVVRTVAKKKLW